MIRRTVLVAFALAGCERLGSDPQTLSFKVDVARRYDQASAAPTVTQRTADAFKKRLAKLDVRNEVVVRDDAVDVRLKRDEPKADSVRAELSRPGRFALREVDEESPLMKVRERRILGTKEEVRNEVAHREPPLPVGHDIVFEEGTDSDEHPLFIAYEVQGPSLLDNESFRSIDAEHTIAGQQVKVELDETGTSALAAATRRLVHRRVAFIVDGEAVAVPEIVEPITNGRMWLSFNATQYRLNADQMAVLLRSSLPAPVTLAR